MFRVFKVERYFTYCISLRFKMHSSTSDSKVRVINCTKLDSSKYVKPMRLEYERDSEKFVWDYIETHDCVSIVVFNKDSKKLIFVKQLRPTLLIKPGVKNPYTLECCAGIVDKDKSLEEIAREEVLEEVGYNIPVSSLQFINSMRLSVGTQGALATSYFVEVSNSQRVSKGGGVDNEKIEIVELDIDEAKKLLWCSEKDYSNPTTALTLIGVCWFFCEYLQRQPHAN